MKPGDPRREAVESQIADLERMRTISLGEIDMIGTMTPGSAANEKVDLERRKFSQKLTDDEARQADLDGIMFTPNIKYDKITGNISTDSKNGVTLQDPGMLVQRFAFLQEYRNKAYADRFLESVRNTLNRLDDQIILKWGGQKADLRKWWAEVDRLARLRWGNGAASEPTIKE